MRTWLEPSFLLLIYLTAKTLHFSPKSVEAVPVERYPEQCCFSLILTNFSDQTFHERCPDSDSLPPPRCNWRIFIGQTGRLFDMWKKKFVLLCLAYVATLRYAIQTSKWGLLFSCIAHVFFWTKSDNFSEQHWSLYWIYSMQTTGLPMILTLFALSATQSWLLSWGAAETGMNCSSRG